MPTPSETQAGVRNRLLASLPPEEFQRLRPLLRGVQLPPRRVLFRADEPVQHVYFPENAVISLFIRMADGSTVEVGMLGRRGMVGLRAFLGSPAMPCDAVVLVTGGALRMRADDFRDACAKSSGLHERMMRFTQALLIQSQQLVACTRLHTLDMRLCRWLLMIRDRIETDDLPLTHEFIARMLGIRREGITVAVRGLQQAGLLSHSRGVIRIEDRRALESAACECYRIINREYDTLLNK